MNKYILILFAFISSFVNAQDLSLCEQCVEQNGFYCGDDPANWTQYSPSGCVPNGYQDLFYINDGWEDCVDGSDENEAAPTTLADCGNYGVEECDTVFITEFETIYETIFDTIIETEIITQIVIDTFEVETIVEIIEYVVADTVYVYEDILDTLFIDVIEEVEVVVYDTIVETEYVEFVITEYIDCESGLPCNSALMEIMDKSKNSSVIYNIKGEIINRREGLYIENGVVKFNPR
tara:strand:+ start:41 stop:745 length:705 start_codon:yes stop_codon:yes gene_type:complete